jgi:hypothetical protein
MSLRLFICTGTPGSGLNAFTLDLVPRYVQRLFNLILLYVMSQTAFIRHIILKCITIEYNLGVGLRESAEATFPSPVRVRGKTAFALIHPPSMFNIACWSCCS